MIEIETKKYCYICSPYKGSALKRIRNIRYAREIGRMAERLTDRAETIKCMRGCIYRRKIRYKRRNGNRNRVGKEKQ